MQNVTIYTTPTCGFCKATKEYFKNNSIAYTEVDVTADPAKAQEIITKSGQMGVPVTVVQKDDASEDIIVGFDQPKLAAALGIAG